MLNRYKDQFTLFLELGFIAVNHADEDSAIKLFTAAEMLRPSEVLTTIGFGYLHFCKLEIKPAIEKFEEALKKEPHNPIAKSLLGFCLALHPGDTQKGEAMLKELKTHTKSKEIQELDGVLLEFINDFVKKKSSPRPNISHPPTR